MLLSERCFLANSSGAEEIFFSFTCARRSRAVATNQIAYELSYLKLTL